MREMVDDLLSWLEAGEAVALATVVRAEGPSPRPVGAHMAISASGRLAGSVSGGCVEGAVAREAEELLAGGPPRRLRYSTKDEDGWEVGLACGGAIEVYVERLTPLHRRLLEALRAGETVALATRLEGGGHALAWPDGRVEGDATLAPDPPSLFASGLLAELRPDPQGEVFVQVFGPPPTLTVIGAVHLAQPLARLAQELGFRVRVADGRRLFATRERFPTADELLVGWPRQVLTPEHLRPQDAVVILTHDPKFDLPALELALNSPVGYVGLLGSRTTQERRRAAFEARGGRAEQWARVHGPVGLDLGGREPAEIALAILAEIVAARHGKA